MGVSGIASNDLPSPVFAMTSNVPASDTGLAGGVPAGAVSRGWSPRGSDVPGHVNKEHTGSWEATAPSQTDSREPCGACCGRHDRKMCRFKNSICLRCQGAGHVVAVCKTPIEALSSSRVLPYNPNIQGSFHTTAPGSGQGNTGKNVMGNKNGKKTETASGGWSRGIVVTTAWLLDHAPLLLSQWVTGHRRFSYQ